MRSRGIIRPHHSKLAVLYKVTDGILIATGHWASRGLATDDWDGDERAGLTVLAALSMFYIIATGKEIYRSWRITSLLREMMALCYAWTVTSLLLVTFAYVLGVLNEFSRSSTILWLLLTPLGLCAWHALVRGICRELRKRGFNTRSVAIIGHTNVGQELAHTIVEASWMGLRFAGFFEDRTPESARTLATDGAESAIKGSIADLLVAARDGHVDLIYIALPLRAEQRLRKIISDFSDTTASLYLAQSFEDYQLLHGNWVLLGETPVAGIFENPFYGPDGWVKRAEDLVLSVVILVLIAVPCLCIALAIKTTSPGSVIFKQRRFGLNGREFMVWKFRTMTSLDDEDQVKQATRGDPRVTAFGRFLRRNSLDELPQFINVLQGTMSIVGPRPHAVAHNQHFRKLVESYMLRHKVKPGITGWAQVNGLRGATDTLDKMEARVAHDLDYIRNWSIYLDLKIIFLTVINGFMGRNAY